MEERRKTQLACAQEQQTQPRGRMLCEHIPSEAEGMRLEQFLRRRMNFTKAQVSAMKFRENGLTVNGERVRVNRLLHEGDVLEIALAGEAEDSGRLVRAHEPVQILYEDADIAAVWKEAGLVLHPAHGHYQDTLSNRLYGYFRQRGEVVKIRSIGRLDKDTSGIVVFAKNQVAAARLWQQKAEGIFWKEYLAVCEGEFTDTAEQTIALPITPMPGEKMKMCVPEEDAAGKAQPAVTHFRVLCQQGGKALLRVRIETGRTHQIRVHLAAIGHPIAGDILYGDAPAHEESGTRMRLCAWKTGFCRPFSGEKITLCREEMMAHYRKLLSDSSPDL